MFQNEYTRVTLEKGSLFSYEIKQNGKSVKVLPPCFEIDGKTVGLSESLKVTDETVKKNGVKLITAKAPLDDFGLTLTVRFRMSPDNPMMKFQYVLSSDEKHQLTKAEGADNLCYMAVETEKDDALTEVRLSEFNEMIHCYVPVELPAFAQEDAIMGPILVGETKDSTYLMAYEHGSQSPDRFIEFKKQAETVSVCAVKGNYYHGQNIGDGAVYESIWLQFGAVLGDEDQMAKHYRDFVLRYMSDNAASRAPYIYYNTWAYQERNKCWNGKTYLASMCLERMLEEIDIAHEMGIDVFVLDTGWYEKTGDWAVDPKRFPDDLKEVKKKLDGYGMKMGLWFNPKAAAVSSRILKENEDCIARENGKLSTPSQIWETEESYQMCLVSKYWKAFADELLRLSEALGVTYFKWDAIGQYGCDSDLHDHGTAQNSDKERDDCYAFQISIALSKIVDYVCEKNPELIVDFDATEGGRCVGLGFLSAGKYFLINNGPYYWDYNIPVDPERYWTNIFVYPGQARNWFMRSPLKYDKWIPSVLFLTHYLPDEPRDSQRISLASMILGQNGIWGDLKAISEEGIALYHSVLSEYKKVRDDITVASPVRWGNIGESFEVHEKINPKTGRGVVVAFSCAGGKYGYRTKNAVSEKHYIEGDIEVVKASPNAELVFDFKKAGAQMIFFE